MKFFTVWKYFLSFRTFEQLVACPEKQSVPWIRCIECIFYHSEFWTTCTCPENRVCPENFHCIEYIFFIIQDFWATCACPEKQNLPWNFSLYWNIFYVSGFLSNLSLPWKQSLPWIFQAGGGGRPPRPPPRTPLATVETLMACQQWSCQKNDIQRVLFHFPLGKFLALI